MREACERWVNACLSCLQVKYPRRMKIPLKLVERSEINEVVLIDHQKICMTEPGYNQILVIIDHFTKLAEAVPCQTASFDEEAEELEQQNGVGGKAVKWNRKVERQNLAGA